MALDAWKGKWSDCKLHETCIRASKKSLAAAVTFPSQPASKSRGQIAPLTITVLYPSPADLVIPIIIRKVNLSRISSRFPCEHVADVGTEI
jgi:hypothetical protein